MGVAKSSYPAKMKEIYYGGKKAFYNEAKAEFDKAYSWVKANCIECSDHNEQAVQHSREQFRLV